MTSPAPAFLRIVREARRTAPFGHFLRHDLQGLYRRARTMGMTRREARAVIDLTAPRRRTPSDRLAFRLSLEKHHA